MIVLKCSPHARLLRLGEYSGSLSVEVGKQPPASVMPDPICGKNNTHNAHACGHAYISYTRVNTNAHAPDYDKSNMISLLIRRPCAAVAERAANQT